MRTPPLRTRQWTRAEYDRLIEKGFFGPEDRIELLDGHLIVSEPKGSRHAVVVELVRAALERAFGAGFYTRAEQPVALDDASEPEPDIAVVRGRPRDYLDAHPSTPVLVVEIAETSLRLDRRRKSAAYARAGLREYWIVNLRAGVLEVYREPARSPADRWKYRSVRLLKRNAVVSPLAAPRSRIRVAALLP